MRRIDVIAITLAVFLGGGLIYVVLNATGLDSFTAGLWAQAILVFGLLGWVGTYAYRAATQTMTYSQQRREYEEAMLQKRLQELSPQELASLQAQLEQDSEAADLPRSPATEAGQTD